ncbi:MAG: hypothetical protein H0V43_08110 [Gemmatimonadales bacterium]|nr:hypothetical protein [Gemmatimonadales bacterium]MBA3556050.1 hypothetical protein [Gemmatimonadales bacterium]
MGGSRVPVPELSRLIRAAGLGALALTAVATGAGAQVPAALEPALLRWTAGPVQLDPEEGDPATERTVVRLLGTARGLYIGLLAYDSVPGEIGRAQLHRDADFTSDDSFTILLDPQQDRRTGYLFSVNPNGALYDAEIMGPDDTNPEWDGRWDAHARLTPWGWSAEVWLPWQRFTRRKNEVALWRGWRRHQGILFHEAQGTLIGLDSLPGRPRAEIRPYVVMAQSQAERDFGDDGGSHIVAASEGDIRIGGDVKLAVAPTMTLDLTLNSDFAQVEVDRQVVNLTRFPLQFPEKRPFFLESSGTFALGEPGEVELFYSRRVGLAEDGTPVPLDAGARLHGRAGPYRVGVLAVRTGGDEDAAGANRIGQGFDPALGFVREDGIQRYIGGFQFFPRPGVLGIRRLDLKPIAWEVADDLDGERAYAFYEIRPLGVEFDGGTAVELNLQRFVDVPGERFEIFPGSVIRPGSYTYDRVEARYLSSADRPWTLDLTASAGEFYDGTATELEASLELRSAPHLITFVDYGVQAVRRPRSDFTAQVVRVGVDLAASPRFGGSVLTQWENESNRLSVNARLHWSPQPGSDVYLAWEQRLAYGAGGRDPLATAAARGADREGRALLSAVVRM